MNNYQSFSNPTFEPIQTPVTTKYDVVFSSQIQNTIPNENIDQFKQDSNQNNALRKSAQFGNQMRYTADGSSLNEKELRNIVKHKRYVACQIF
ncbi:unnamed protein product [Paramecium sonneborni]|uniref:Uncharacterized protein n=1 Tax=Paramecium sonneborni TaxID=65129 RepID=A0A8S1MZA0_9CILI|nr:unnamed protein product [Paramecium sonneborni]